MANCLVRMCVFGRPAASQSNVNLASLPVRPKVFGLPASLSLPSFLTSW